MRTVETDLLRRLAAMPFLDRLEAAAVSGWSKGAAYNAVEALEREGLAVSVSHASELIPPTRRYGLTAAGLHRLARAEGMTVDELLRLYPVSEQWRRILLERLDAVGVIYRLASAIAGAAFPVRFRWYRAAPVDAAIGLPGGRVLAIVRQGRTADRTAFAKRLWRLREGPRPSAVLLLVPDEVRLRHARRLLAGAPFAAYLAPERDVVSAGTGAPVWSTVAGTAPIGLADALARTKPWGAWPGEELPVRGSLPDDISDGNDGDWMLPALLKPTEKRALDLVSDWPWLAPAHLGELLGVKRSRLSGIIAQLTALGLAASAETEGGRRLVPTDRGLTVLARRDRASIGAARKRWSTSPLDLTAPLSWRNVSGSRSRQLLRNAEHTESVHWFAAVLERQAHSRGRELVQLDPPHRASRHFRHGGSLRSVHPDAFGILRHGGSATPFFLEWERRAVRPVTMAERIAPYLRYFSSGRPVDDHGALPIVLVVFEDDLNATHFLRVAGGEMDRSGVRVPLFVSHRDLLEQVGPLGPAWRIPGGGEPSYAFR
ncbi:MAG: hypothetical protein F4185_06420 [Chloroflexi bacterium]|nr:hypothetical protein [Chloroflexota bacterium]MYF65514.1 hypothetical protein [Chloroflexota bacterium]MYK34169.1 hypothetical protein [Chloroflexota bacterium]